MIFSVGYCVFNDLLQHGDSWNICHINSCNILWTPSIAVTPLRCETGFYPSPFKRWNWGWLAVSCDQNPSFFHFSFWKRLNPPRKTAQSSLVDSDRLALARLRVRQLLAKTSASQSARARVTCWGVRLTAGDWKIKNNYIKNNYIKYIKYIQYIYIYIRIFDFAKNI